VGQLTPVTRVILGVYALSIPVSWVVRYAPGQSLLQLEVVENVEDPLLSVRFVAGGGGKALLGLVGSDRVLDWSKSEQLTTHPVRLAPRLIDYEWTAHQTRVTRQGIDALAWVDGKHYHYRYQKKPQPTLQREVPADALWIAPSGRIVRADGVNARSERAFGAKPFGNALWHVGRFVVARPETVRHDQKKFAARQDFLVFDAEKGDPVQKLETDTLIESVFESPGWAGLLYGSAHYAYLRFLQCGEQGCKSDYVRLAADRSAVRAACYDPRFERIALCTEHALYLYAGAPGDEDIVCLGHAELEDPCDQVWIASESTLLLSLDEGLYAVAHFARAP
jgi:hypothetical protein